MRNVEGGEMDIPEDRNIQKTLKSTAPNQKRDGGGMSVQTL
jgi:hypothetical protein